MSKTPAAKSRKLRRFNPACQRPPIFFSSAVHVGCKIRMASVRTRTPADWRIGCGLNRGIKGGLLNTADQTRATRRKAPNWASQPVPGEGFGRLARANIGRGA